MTGISRVAAATAPLLVLIAGVASLTGIGVLVGGLDGVLTIGLVYLVLTTGLWIFTGTSGVLSFGHVSFMALGAYLSAIVTIPASSKDFLLPDLPSLLADVSLSWPLALAVSVAFCGLVALLVGFPIMRLSGLAASIATLSGLVIVNVVLSNWDALTAGTGTLGRIPVTVGVGTALIAAIIALTVAYVFSRSATGLGLRASREDLVAARMIGIDVTRGRLSAFALSAMVMGAGGYLYAHYLGSINPSAFYLQLTFLLIAMLVIGGLTSLSGAVVGTIVLTAITEGSQRLQDAGTIPPGVSYLAVSVLVIVILAVRPRGITDGRDLAIRPPSAATEGRVSRRQLT